ncbi:MAG: hypothetical protein HC799_15305 [Limnothrix sp. RL_2_0]|nr:hypothetical protein [Limnothrix sp. RL_2_0]
MNDNHYIADSDDVFVIFNEFGKIVPYHTIRTEDFLETIRQYIQLYIQNNKRVSPDDARDITAAWIGEEGVGCQLLSPSQKWKTGTVKLALIFEEEKEEESETVEPESPLDDIRKELNKDSEKEI